MLNLSLAALLAMMPAAGASLAVAPTSFSGDVGELPTALFDDALLTAVQHNTGTSVIGADDISAMIGFEETKELVGCDATNCIADIGGALGVDRLMSMKVANLGSDWVVTSKIINIRDIKVETRSSDFVEGGARQLLTALPGIVDKLFKGGGGVALAAPAPSTTGTAAAAPAPVAVAGPETDRAIMAMSASLRDKAKKLWPKGDLEEATPVPDTLVALATYRLRKIGAIGTGDAYGAARKGCRSKKVVPACVEASDRLFTGYGISESPQQAGEYLLRACELGDEMACTNLRAMVAAYFSGRSQHRKTTAEHMLVKMCLAEVPNSCEPLRTQGGEGVIDALAVACDQQNNAGACATLVAKGGQWRIGRNTRYIGYALFAGTLIFGGLTALNYAAAKNAEKNGGTATFDARWPLMAIGSFVAGVGFTSYGIYRVARAKSRANEGVSRTAALLPLILREEDTTYSGLGLLWAF